MSALEPESASVSVSAAVSAAVSVRESAEVSVRESELRSVPASEAEVPVVQVEPLPAEEEVVVEAAALRGVQAAEPQAVPAVRDPLQQQGTHLYLLRHLRFRFEQRRTGSLLHGRIIAPKRERRSRSEQ